ncbi:SCO family protein [uncultured Allomuricauda sp.]|uniref:SCO family protein n=1 Tax=Flagellimonas sp. W118 TaxID=3410791 RepID=UPI00260DB4D0|nr:SCO family protein [uncultured Allomuricauda sp.]
MTKAALKKYKRTKGLMVLLTISFLVAFYIIYQSGTKLPILGPKDFNPELVDNSLQQMEKQHVVADFKLINHNGETVTQLDYENKIYVTDFFFTRCPSICPIMSNNMEKLQEAFLNNDDVMFLSMSVTPEMDNVPVLKKYADRHGVIDSKWNITTGDKKHIYNLARKSYFAAVDYGDGGLQDFIHTPNFVLVDKEKRIRGVYDGTVDEDILRLTNDIKVLANKP